MQAVSEHADGYVRYRALVLLTGFNDPRAKDSMREALARTTVCAPSRTDSSSTIPDPAMIPAFLDALEKEQGEFVRPALVRALAAEGVANPGARPALVRDVARGQDYFPQRRHRSARRLQGAVRVRGHHRRGQARGAAAGRRRDRARQDRRQARARHAGRHPAHGAEIGAAVDRRRHLPARRQLRIARELSRRDAEILRQERRLSGAAARRRVRAGGARRRRPHRSGRRLVHRRHSLARSDARASGARARDRRAPQHAA